MIAVISVMKNKWSGVGGKRPSSRPCPSYPATVKIDQERFSDFALSCFLLSSEFLDPPLYSVLDFFSKNIRTGS